MLSADPLPQITLARLAAQTVPRVSGSIRFPAHHLLHHLLVTPDSCAALALVGLGHEPTRRSLRGNFPIDRLAPRNREGNARHLVGERHSDKLERFLLHEFVSPIRSGSVCGVR